nr:MAG TPA: hypothetical protein [Caudoviricetes sp.]
MHDLQIPFLSLYFKNISLLYTIFNSPWRRLL